MREQPDSAEHEDSQKSDPCPSLARGTEVPWRLALLGDLNISCTDRAESLCSIARFVDRAGTPQSRIRAGDDRLDVAPVSEDTQRGIPGAVGHLNAVALLKYLATSCLCVTVITADVTNP